MQIETIQIQTQPSEDNPTGIVIINKCDFDPEIHVTVEAYEAGVKASREEAARQEADRKAAEEDAAKNAADSHAPSPKKKNDK